MTANPEILIERARQAAKRHGHSQVTAAHIAEVIAQDVPERPPYLTARIEKLLGAQVRDYGTVTVPIALKTLVRTRWKSDPLAMLTDLLHIDVPVPAPRPAPNADGDAPQLPFADAEASDNVPPAVEGEAAISAPHMRMDYPALAARLKQRVRGQEEAIEHVVARLAVFQRQLDARPERPDGVFLFAGPTGVGKTELAKSIAELIFGDAEALLRIDMSEYTHPAEVSRLIGPGPGYVGHDEPSSWLTSRIIKQPNCVLLLDEVEKAHPTVWNTFLQIFDAGRLTDGRGRVADFSRVVIIMTTNVGADVYANKAPIGLVNNDTGATEESQVMRELQHVFRPELMNRIDEIILFRPLSHEIVLDIARMHVDGALQRLSRSGYQVANPEVLAEFIARVGYDRQYGARPILRAIDEHMMAPLAILEPGPYAVREHGAHLQWQHVGTPVPPA